MTHPLSRIPFLGTLVDERFLEHRRRATSFAGIVTAVFALVVVYYRFVRYHVISRDLLIVAALFIVLKYAALAWYRLRD